MNLVWTKETANLHSAGNDVSVCRRAGGWGQRFNAYCKREWAAKVDGDFLKTRGNNTRQFASSAAAKRAVEERLLN